MPEYETKNKPRVIIAGDGNIIGDQNSSRLVKQVTSNGLVTGAVHTGAGDIDVEESPTSTQEQLATRISAQRGGDASLQTYIPLLKALGEYFRLTLPSRVDLNVILEAEHMLNDLYLRANREIKNRETIEEIMIALALSSELSFSVKRHSSGRYEMRFFTNIKRLGENLITLANNIVA